MLPAMTAPAAPRLRVLAVATAAAVLVVDQATKFWAESALAGRPPVPVLGDFLSLRLVRNPGAAFSLGADVTWVFAILAAVAVVGLGWFVGRVRSTPWALVAGLLLGGATTHLLDRLFRPPGFGVGHVVDFLDYNGWFVGNVADIALVGGAIAAVLLSLGDKGE